MAPALTEEQTVAVMAAIMSRVKCLAGMMNLQGSKKLHQQETVITSMISSGHSPFCRYNDDKRQKNKG